MSHELTPLFVHEFATHESKRATCGGEHTKVYLASEVDPLVKGLRDRRTTAESLAQAHGWPGYSQGGDPVSYLATELEQALVDGVVLWKILEAAPTGVKGETHGDLVARYYLWYEGIRKAALAEPHTGTALLDERVALREEQARGMKT